MQFCRWFAVRCAAPVALLLLVAGCATQRPAPVEDRVRGAPTPPTAVATPGAIPAAPEPDWRPPTYLVKRGDTLYQIALDHGLDYRDLASWNALENPNLILIGQSLRLQAPVTGIARALLDEMYPGSLGGGVIVQSRNGATT